MRRAERSRSVKRVKKRVPSGVARLFFKKQMPGKAVCGSCSAELHGIPRLSSSKLRAAGKSEKSVNRKFGGALCSACSRARIKQEARVMFK